MDVTAWLLDSDPSIRWQVLRDVTGASANEVAAERARVATEGWGAQLLAARDPNGLWAGGAFCPAEGRSDDTPGQPWTSTQPSLELLRTYGLAPTSPVAVEMIALVREHGRWEHDGQAYFDGEVEACINGRTVTVGAYFGQDVQGIVDRLLSEQLEDGGWNCFTEYGSVRSSFDSTLCVLEGLLEHEQAGHGSAEVTSARQRGEDYLLERRLLRRLSTGEVIHPHWLQPAFPVTYAYDVLRVLDYFRLTGQSPDPRMEEAVFAVRAGQQPDGRWLLEREHPGQVHFRMEAVGEASRWQTLRALRVLRWWDAAA